MYKIINHSINPAPIDYYDLFINYYRSVDYRIETSCTLAFLRNGIRVAHYLNSSLFCPITLQCTIVSTYITSKSTRDTVNVYVFVTFGMCSCFLTLSEQFSRICPDSPDFFSPHFMEDR